MPRPAPLVEVDISALTRAEWLKILWGVLTRGARYTIPPLLIIVGTIAVFGLVVALIALKVGVSPKTVEENEVVFEIAGDLLSAVVGVYAFARNLRALPKLHLGRYRFALVRCDESSR